MIEDGGKSDFHYGHDWQAMGQQPVKVDRVLPTATWRGWAKSC